MKVFIKSLIGLVGMWLLIGLPIYVIFELIGIDKGTYWTLCFLGSVIYLLYVNGKGEEK
jgi:hypothetical protein